MDDFSVSPGGVVLPRIKPIRMGLIVPTVQIEEWFPWMGRKDRRAIGDVIRLPERERIGVLKMAGSLSNYTSKLISDLIWGKTAYAGETNVYTGLWAAALDDTFTGATGSECAYTSYARMLMVNNTTNFAAGTGTTTYTKTFPSDAVHSFTASTGTGTNNTVTYMGFLNGNVGTSADKGIAWCTITSTTINNGDTPQLAQNAVTDVQD
jgi:hypothetical protein